MFAAARLVNDYSANGRYTLPPRARAPRFDWLHGEETASRESSENDGLERKKQRCNENEECIARLQFHKAAAAEGLLNTVGRMISGGTVESSRDC